MPARILIMNDTRNILTWYHRFLQQEGYLVQTTTFDAHVRDVVIEEFCPDLILLDFVLSSQEDLLPLLRSLKGNQATASIPLLLCTIWQQEIHLREQEFALQGIEVLYKPFRIEDLFSLIRQMLLQHHEPNSRS
jgi:DNA-binding response OmpR family regulator